MANVFDYVNAINFTKKDLMTGTENDELAEKDYVAFLTNRSLSNFTDTVLYANEMNMRSYLDNKLQFYYLINSIRPRKRFSKWAKRQDSNDFEAVKEYFKYSNTKTQQALSLLTPDQIKTIRQRLITGGHKNE